MEFSPRKRVKLLPAKGSVAQQIVRRNIFVQCTSAFILNAGNHAETALAMDRIAAQR